MIARLARMGRLAVKYRDPAWVTKGRTGWLHRYRNGVLVTPTLRGVPWRIAESDFLDYNCFEYTPGSGDTVVEVGAEFGTDTIFLSRLVGPAGRVIAVEAHPETCAVLAELVEVNGLTNVAVVQAALTDESGTTTISDGDAVSNTVGQGDIEVPALSFGDLLRKYDVEKVDFLKVNIEGAEGPLMAGMTAEDGERVRHAAISCHDFRADKGHGEWYRTGEQVDRDLERLGFQWKRRDHDRPWVAGYRYAWR